MDIVPDLAAGFYWEGTCEGSISVTGHNCPMSGTGANCPNNGIDSEITHTVGGDPAKTYSVTIDVNGVIGTRCYKGGTRASTAAPSETEPNNWWYVGGSYANPTGWWNTYEMHVSPSTGEAMGDVFYFNGSDVEGGNWCEKEASYIAKYTATFKVKGGGTLSFKIHDQNCKAQQNCGPDPDPNSLCNPREIDLAGVSPLPPDSMMFPPTNVLDKTYYPQWMWIVATAVAESE